MNACHYSILLFAALAACGPQGQPHSNVGAQMSDSTSAAPGVTNSVSPTAAAPTAPPRTSLPEPKGPIDPKSLEAAGQVVQHYGALIEQKRWTESRQFWGDSAAAKAFEGNFRTWANVHLEIGDLGPAEGAAGSIFTNMPVTFYGDLNAGGPGSLKGNVILRRVNDVPGSTEAQRRWHIERIELKSTG